jgi:hypothetical protein
MDSAHQFTQCIFNPRAIRILPCKMEVSLPHTRTSRFASYATRSLLARPSRAEARGSNIRLGHP